MDDPRFPRRFSSAGVFRRRHLITSRAVAFSTATAAARTGFDIAASLPHYDTPFSKTRETYSKIENSNSTTTTTIEIVMVEFFLSVFQLFHRKIFASGSLRVCRARVR